MLEGTKKRAVKVERKQAEREVRTFGRPLNPYAVAPRDVEQRFIDFNKSQSEIHEYKRMNKQSENTGHFIRRMTNSGGIDRKCGVSYVLEAESKHLGLSDRYPVIQGSYSYSPFGEEEKDDLSRVEALFERLFARGPVVVACIESPREEEMKRYLLHPEQRSTIALDRFWLVREPLTELWRFVKDKHFLCVHFRFNS